VYWKSAPPVGIKWLHLNLFCQIYSVTNLFRGFPRSRASTGCTREVSFKWHLTEHLYNRCQLKETSCGCTVLTVKSGETHETNRSVNKSGRINLGTTAPCLLSKSPSHVLSRRTLHIFIDIHYSILPGGFTHRFVSQISPLFRTSLGHRRETSFNS